MRFIFPTLAFLFFVPLAHANEAATTINKGFERERFKDAYNPKAECEYPNSCEGDGKKYGRSDGELTDAQTGGRLNEFVDRKHVHWKVKRPYNPSGLGFLSPCQAQVQDEINAHTGENDEIIFTGHPKSGLAFDRYGNRYNFSCAGGNISIW
ncbi:MAG: hypothetical protein SFW65_10335 [Alphaproteobacteria bacterium]|nr:hypothetical protein [Alphaproteobacteria bacterium]